MISPGVPPVAGTLLVVSRTSHVFALGNGQILKLYPLGQEAAAEREVAASELVHSLGVPSPAVLGTRIEQGRKGIVFALLDGESLRAWLGLGKPWRVGQAAQTLAQVQVGLHAYHASSLPSLTANLERAILAARFAPLRLRARALDMLHALPADDVLCHGDLTPANILLTASGPAIIDWAEACHGDPAADIALTMLHLAISHLYFRRERRPFAWAVNHAVLTEYRRYLHTSHPDLLARAEQWLLPVTVARLAMGAPISPHALVRLSQAYAQRVARAGTEGPADHPKTAV